MAFLRFGRSIRQGESNRSESWYGTCPIRRVGSNGRCNTIWYKAVFKGGVYETRETVWAFSGAEERCVASLEVRADVAGDRARFSTLGKIVIGLRGAGIQFVTDGLGINAPAFVTKPLRSNKKGEPHGSRFFS